MNDNASVYIKRIVEIDGSPHSEDYLLGTFRVAIILAEPGAGKTELLKNLATQTGSHRYRASIFRYKSNIEGHEPLIIDGIDELAKMDQVAVDEIIVKAGEHEAKKVVFASRSAQWESARTRTVKEVFGDEPLVVKLRPFSEEEQKMLFTAHKAEENFETFQNALKEIDAEGLLSNPQMLKTFANAYTQSGGSFFSKNQVFHDAIEYLANEKNPNHAQSGRLPTSEIVAQSDELFCKILISGCTGVASTQSAEDRDFPYANELLRRTHLQQSIALDTGLFTLSDHIDRYEPSHRIIAEYSAARYLAKRITDPSDRLSLKRILALLAPNNTPRGELRGLLAWVATQGDGQIEQAIIEIDPYAILSNGDPSQLTEKSKSSLLQKLKKVAEDNPHFRGGDIWRHFSAKGFFSGDALETTKEILLDDTASPELRRLLLELLQGTSAAGELADDLTSLLLNPESDEYVRILALRSLQTFESFDALFVFETLIEERSPRSISLTAELVEGKGVNTFGQQAVLELFNVIDELFFPNQRTRRRPRVERYGSRFFITNLVNSFQTEDVIWLLSELSRDLTCDCDKKKRYDCFCRNGKSHLIGMLLDRLFELNQMTPTAEQLWQWTKGLRFEHGIRSADSAAVAALQENDELRQAVHLVAFGQLTDEEAILDIKVGLNMNDGHSGLLFKKDDYQALTDFAFEMNNPVLWSSFYPPHRLFVKENFEFPLRARMRKQAHEKPAFGRVWASRERAFRRSVREDRLRPFNRSKRMRKRRQAERLVQSENQRHFDENRALIESGQHWGWLTCFAEGYLHQSDEHLSEMDDKGLPARALVNCFDFIKSSIPSLEKVAESTGVYTSVIVANAACLAYFRAHGTLREIDKAILQTVLTQTNVHYPNMEDSEAYQAELHEQVFQTTSDVEGFARRLIEPQLSDSSRDHTDVGWLAHRKHFHPLRHSLPIEWLERFPNTKLNSMGTLFDLAAEFSPHDRLRAIIDAQLNLGPAPEDEQELEEYCKRRNFWWLRKFFFFEECDQSMVDWLEEDRDHALAIHSITGRFSREENRGWPELNAEKIKLVLQTYVDKWPKVHLPSSYGTGDPPEETAYRFLTDIVWRIGKDVCEKAIEVVDELAADPRFDEFSVALKTLRSEALRKIALRDFAPPLPKEVAEMLDNQKIATVEDLRALLIELLEETQAWLNGAETDPLEQFYTSPKEGKKKHVDENTATKRIVERLQLQCKALGIAMTIEHHFHKGKRCDITFRFSTSGIERLLVVEAKGQWNSELYSAVATQLDRQYTIHPDAADQGIYLVYWFGKDHPIAGTKKHPIESAIALKQEIIVSVPEELRSRIDVFVLDLSI